MWKRLTVEFYSPVYSEKNLPLSDTLHNEAGCSQEEGPKKGFVMGSRTRDVQEILEKCI